MEDLKEQARLKKKFDSMNEQAKKRTIWINRIPPTTKKRFLEIADDEFEGDWGMCLKFLIDFRDGILQNPNQVLEQKINLLADDFSALRKRMESLEEKKDTEEVTSASGKKLRTGDKK